MVGTGVVEGFRQFIERAREVLAASQKPPGPPPIAAFHIFLECARPLATRHARAYLDRFVSRAALLRPWLSSCDLLAVAGLSYAEDRYTELIAWAMRPERGEAIAL